MQTLLKFGAVIGLGAVMMGCAVSGTQAPTHRWESTAAADEIQYRQDHARCQAQAQAGQDNVEFRVESPAFASYKQCMNNRGYVLTAYRDAHE